MKKLATMLMLSVVVLLVAAPAQAASFDIGNPLIGGYVSPVWRDGSGDPRPYMHAYSGFGYATSWYAGGYALRQHSNTVNAGAYATWKIDTSLQVDEVRATDNMVHNSGPTTYYTSYSSDNVTYTDLQRISYATFGDKTVGGTAQLSTPITGSVYFQHGNEGGDGTTTTTHEYLRTAMQVFGASSATSFSSYFHNSSDTYLAYSKTNIAYNSSTCGFANYNGSVAMEAVFRVKTTYDFDGIDVRIVGDTNDNYEAINTNLGDGNKFAIAWSTSLNGTYTDIYTLTGAQTVLNSANAGAGATFSDTDELFIKVYTAGTGTGFYSRFNGLQIETIPEPATLVMLGLGGIGVLIRRRRRA